MSRLLEKLNKKKEDCIYKKLLALALVMVMAASAALAQTQTPSGTISIKRNSASALMGDS